VPKLSIVIPTRARADTLRHALRTALDQSFTDIEVIVHESGADPATANVIDEVDDPRVRFYRSERPVRMCENWEMALDHVRGDYVFYMGDDDGIFPDACEIAAWFFSSQDVEILSWTFPLFYWPTFPAADLRNRMIGTTKTKLEFTTKEPRHILPLIYRFREHYSRLPMVYNSFVSRRLIERIRRQRGRYFIGSSPDIVSGVTNACFVDRYATCSRPLSLAGLSHNSTGVRSSLSGDPETRRKSDDAAFGEFIVHPTMVRSPNITLVVGNELLIVRDAIFPDEPPKLGYREMLWEAAQSLNATPTQYAEVKGHIRAIALKNGIAFESLPIPEPEGTPAAGPSKSCSGVLPSGKDTISFDIDGDSHQIATVADAVKHLAGHLPSKGAVVDIAPAEAPRKLAPEHDKPAVADVSSNGTGSSFLGTGWCIPEYWGVWTFGEFAQLSLAFGERPAGGLLVRLEGRAAAFPAHPQIRFTVFCDGRFVGSKIARLGVPFEAIELDPIDSAMLDRTNTLHLTVEIDRPMRPIEHGMGADTRPIGFGLERIVVSALPTKGMLSTSAAKLRQLVGWN
jgi:hypothetical protein